jgi:hypothetical protein
MKRLRHHLRANLVAYLALFTALGGTSYAAINLPPGSVGERQIKNHVIDPIKLDPRYIGGSVRAWVEVGASGNIVSSSGPVRVEHPPTSSDYLFTWHAKLPRSCIVIASVNNEFADGFADASLLGDRGAQVTAFNPSGQRVPARVAVAVIC